MDRTSNHDDFIRLVTLATWQQEDRALVNPAQDPKNINKKRVNSPF
jgi:hypothetical protein